MANWYTQWWGNLQAAIAPAWPEVAGKFWQDNAVERLDWVNLLDSGELTIPWCVVSLDIQPTDQISTSICYQIAATIWYISSLSAAKDAGVTATSLVTSRLVDLQVALLALPTPSGIGAVDQSIAFDITAHNPVNVSFLDAKLPYQAGSISVTFNLAMLNQ